MACLESPGKLVAELGLKPRPLIRVFLCAAAPLVGLKLFLAYPGPQSVLPGPEFPQPQNLLCCPVRECGWCLFRHSEWSTAEALLAFPSPLGLQGRETLPRSPK